MAEPESGGEEQRRPPAREELERRTSDGPVKRRPERERDAGAGLAARAGAGAGVGARGGRETWLGRDVRLVHEDDDVIVVDKPAGLVTAIPDQPEIDSVFARVKAHVRRKAAKRGTRAWIVHRLDREASGLLVFAKSETAFNWLKDDFRARRVHRLYAAVVQGEMKDDRPEGEAKSLLGRRIVQAMSGTVRSFLYEDEQGLVHSVDSQMAGPKGEAKSEDDDDTSGKPRLAVTHWKVAQAGKGRTLLHIRLETGRKHQIRVHMQTLGHGIVGDQRYGGATGQDGRLCLHAIELGFTHPTSGASLRFRSPMPPEFARLVGMATSEPGPSDEGQSEAKEESRAPAVRGGREAAADTAWEHVAAWYDELLRDRGSDHHERVIVPGALRLLQAQAKERVLDVACGQGILCSRLTEQGVEAVGVDAAPALIKAAARHVPSARFVVGDARDLVTLAQTQAWQAFDAAACVMALMNIEPMGPVMRGVAELLRPGGRFVAVILHPAFRAPGQSSWGWEEGKGGGGRQYRRVDGYLSPAQKEIVMNPGAAAHGGEPVVTTTFHRPLEAYVRAFAEAGLLVDAMEEWPSSRLSEPGPRAREENRARREIPLFMGIRAVKVGTAGSAG
jgi:23S rRNA-/tRNA-specific pseudouridylate synthase/SAM-dependent methyltransferase